LFEPQLIPRPIRVREEHNTADSARLIAYVALSLACLAAAVGEPHRFTRRVLLLFAAGALAFGFAVTFELGHAIADLGRTLAGREGWYGDRRPVQAWAIVGLMVAAPVVAFLAWRRLTHIGQAVRGLLVLGTLLCAFVAVRAISLHHLDWYLGRPVRGSLLWGDVLELLLIVVLALYALTLLSLRPRKIERAEPEGDLFRG